MRHINILFKITNGVKQGCVLASTPFILFFGMMLQQITDELDNKNSVYIRCRTNGSLFNLRRLQAHTKTKDKLISYSELRKSEEDLCSPSAGGWRTQEEYHPHSISIEQFEMTVVHQLSYLCVITSDAKIDKEVDNRLALINCAFGRYTNVSETTQI